MPSLSASSRLVGHASRLLLADKGTDGGKTHGTRRVGFDERQAKRVRPSREEKQSKEQLRSELESYTTSEFQRECDDIFDAIEVRVKNATLKITNPVMALERIKIDLGPTGGGAATAGAPAANHRPLIQLASLVKISRNQIEVHALSAQHTTLLMQRLTRYDPSLQPTKISDGKIRITLVQVTRERRERIAQDIARLQHDFIARMKIQRNHAIAYIADFALEQDTTAAATKDVDEAYHNFVAEKTQWFVEAQDAILTASTDDDTETRDVSPESVGQDAAADAASHDEPRQ